jgi:hypothetical protein
MNLELKKFDMSEITSDKVVVLIVKRNTGKSFLVKDLLYRHRKIPIGTVISATEAANPFYANILPSLFIHDYYTPEIIANVCKRQKLIVTKMRADISKYSESKINPDAFLILDDCLFDNSWVRDTNIRSLFMNGRHYKILFIITMQYALGIPPNLRTNIDFVFILRENYVSNRKRLYEHYAGMFPTFEMFCQVMDQCTENYECLVINNSATSNKLEDQVFWYKASSHADYKIGAPEFWQHHNRHYSANAITDGSQDTIKPKIRGPSIYVKKSS